MQCSCFCGRQNPEGAALLAQTGHGLFFVKKVNIHPTLGHLWSPGYEPVRNILKEQAGQGQGLSQALAYDLLDVYLSCVT